MLGTAVYDQIVPLKGEPTVAWGGVLYSIEAARAALPSSWRLRPIVTLGSDLAESALGEISALPRTDQEGVLITSRPNNRVELVYTSASERTETLSGGVGAWTTIDLAPRLVGLDALYVNFVSGYELSLDVAERSLRELKIPVYADLHSLFLDIKADGTRVPRPLPDFLRWIRCFDAIQMNRDEATLATGSVETTVTLALDAGVELVLVTSGEDGATWWLRDGERTESGSVTIPRPRDGDPTGCGDVWGGVFFSRFVTGTDVARAASDATRLASRAVEHVGSSGLYDILRTELVS